MLPGCFSPRETLEDLATKVRWAHQHAEAMRMMGANARRVYEEKYSPSVNFGQLAKIYEAAIAQSQSAASGQEKHRLTIIAGVRSEYEPDSLPVGKNSTRRV